MKSVMSHTFSRVPHVSIPRSQFKRSSGFKATFNAGDLIPIFVDEVLPGDTFNLQENLFGRLNTPLVPIMDNLFLDTFYFFVPNRLIWDNWLKFNGEQKNPGDSTDYLVPTLTADAVTGFTENSIHDYFGIPTKVKSLEVNSLHHRAYNLCWNSWFRDENLQNSVEVPTGDGPDNLADFKILKRGKRHDYFTSCLPWPQKGESVSLPLGDKAPVYGNPADQHADFPSHAFMIRDSAASINSWANLEQEKPLGEPTLRFSDIPSGGYLDNVYRVTLAHKGGYDYLNSIHPDNYLPPFADLSEATASTVNQLREAITIQQLFERDARGGTRYTEIIRSHFGVISPDARLQRPEYLGGSTSYVHINPVAQTSESNDTPQGNLAAYGTVSKSGRGFVSSFTEHGVLIGLCCLRADLNYQNGLHKMWSRQTRFDFYWPTFANLGEQAVLNKEIFAQGTADDDKVFGYQERYAEYRYKNSIVTSLFRSNATTSLDLWHLSQDFANLPVLNDEFIEENPPIDRIVATPSEPDMKLDAYFNLICARPMPLYSVPGLLRL